MTLAVSSPAFAVAALCAGVMGLAIQRGATCTVAAVDELINKRRANRWLALLEASLWVAGGLLVAQAFGVLPQMPPGYAVTWATVGGGVLLGLGAYINGACVFGAIARFGSGQWAYALTPLGFYAGCLSVGDVFTPMLPQRLPYDSPVLTAPVWAAWLFLALAFTRVGWSWWTARHEGWRVAERVWSPHGATTVIGIAFVIMLLQAGAWAYTDLLAELARGMANNLLVRSLLLLALLGGAVIGGWTAGRFASRRIDALQLSKCFAGGLLMGWGSLLIPGSNDGLILVGMPLLWPYAWLAFAAMCVAIAAALWMRRALLPTEPDVNAG
jgi:Sulphur transport